MQTLDGSTCTDVNCQSTDSEDSAQEIFESYPVQKSMGKLLFVHLGRRMEDLGHPGTPGHVHGISVDLLRSQGNSIRHGESGGKPICFCSFLHFQKHPLVKSTLQYQPCKTYLTHCQGSLMKGNICYPPRNYPHGQLEFH